MKTNFKHKTLTMYVLAFVISVNIFTACSAKSISGSVNIIDSAMNIYVVNINAKTSSPENPVLLELAPGTYHVSVIGVKEGGEYDSWKPWYHFPKKGSKGKWIFGWVNKYSFSSSEFGEITITDSTIYKNSSLALANAKDCTFTLIKKSNVYFYIRDTPRFDNFGGISLRIACETPKK